MRFKAWSAGSSPRENQQPNPLALKALQLAGISTEGLRSKSWDDFAGADAPEMDLIITVCDTAAGETCPYGRAIPQPPTGATRIPRWWKARQSSGWRLSSRHSTPSGAASTF